MNTTINFGYAEEQLPEAALEEETDLFFYAWANYLQEIGADKTSSEVELLIIERG